MTTEPHDSPAPPEYYEPPHPFHSTHISPHCTCVWEWEGPAYRMVLARRGCPLHWWRGEEPLRWLRKDD